MGLGQGGDHVAPRPRAGGDPVDQQEDGARARLPVGHGVAVQPDLVAAKVLAHAVATGFVPAGLRRNAARLPGRRSPSSSMTVARRTSAQAISPRMESVMSRTTP